MSLSQLQAPRIENNYGSLASSLLSAGSNSTNVSINAQNQAINNMSNAFKTLSDKLYDYNGSKALATANKIDNINDYNRAMEDGTINLNGLRMEDMAKLDQRKNTLIQRENAMLQLGQQQRAVEDEMNARDFEAKNPDAIAHYNELMAKGDLLGAKNYLKELQASGALTAGGYSWIKNKQNILDGLNDFKTLEDIRQGDERLAEQARANRAREGIEAKNLALKEQQLKAQAQNQNQKQILDGAVTRAWGQIIRLDSNDPKYYDRVNHIINLESGGDPSVANYLYGALNKNFKLEPTNLMAMDDNTSITKSEDLNKKLTILNTKLINNLNPKSTITETAVDSIRGITRAKTYGEVKTAIGKSKAEAGAMEKRVMDEISKKIGINSGGNQKVHLMDKSTRDLLQKVDTGDTNSITDAWEKFTGEKLDDSGRAEFIKDLRVGLQEFNQDKGTNYSLSDYLLAKVQNKYDGSWKLPFGIGNHTNDYVATISATRINQGKDYDEYDRLASKLEAARAKMDKIAEAYSKNNINSRGGYENFATQYNQAQADYYQILEELKEFSKTINGFN